MSSQLEDLEQDLYIHVQQDAELYKDYSAFGDNGGVAASDDRGFYNKDVQGKIDDMLRYEWASLKNEYYQSYRRLVSMLSMRAAERYRVNIEWGEFDSFKTLDDVARYILANGGR